MRSLKLTIAPADGRIPTPSWDDRHPAVHTQRNLDGSIWAYTYSDGPERWMHVPGIASFRFGSRGEEALVVLEPGTALTMETIEDTYQRAVLPMALHAHGAEVVHASAVLTENGVVAFCGRSQTGKSTLAYGLHRRGYNVWADDALVFDSDAGAISAMPFPHRLRIRSEAAEYFDLDELRRRDTSSWTALEQPQDEPAPVTCIFLLEPDAEAKTQVETTRLAPAEALTSLLEHAYWFRLEDAERRRQMVGRYFELATQVPVFRMRFGAVLDRLPEILDRVESVVRTLMES